MLMPPLLLPIGSFFTASSAAVTINTEAFSHSSRPRVRGFAIAIGTLRVNSSRRLRLRMRNDDDDDDDFGTTFPPSPSKTLLALLSSSSDVSSMSGDDGEAKSLAKHEIAILESRFLHRSHYYYMDGNNNSTSSNIMKEDDKSPSSSLPSLSPLSRFQPLLGLYDVKSVIASNPKENPVGGKWTRSNGLVQKLFRTRATLQHLLPFNATGQSSFHLSSLSAKTTSPKAVAEAVNVVSLDAFNGTFRITIVLRGDAVPLSSEERQERNSMNKAITTSAAAPLQLSNLALRVYFDPPRIYFGKRRRCNRREGVRNARAGGHGAWSGNNEYSYFPLQLGPKSSVLLDTTYYDNEVRIGMGGTSGTRFVFALTNTEEANEFEALMKIPFVKKYKVVRMLGLIFAASLNVAYPELLRQLFTPKFIVKASAVVASVPLASSLEWRPWRWETWILFRLIGGTISIISGMAMLAIFLSRGGIERGDNGPSESSRGGNGRGRQESK